MAQKMYKGRPIKDAVTVKLVEIDGEMKEVISMPPGMKDPYLDTVKKDGRRTTKPNPTKDGILDALLEVLGQMAGDGKVFKSKGGKYSIQTDDGKWFSMALSANRGTPDELREIEGGE